MALADLVVVMERGRIRQAGDPREVFRRPNTAFVARFFGGHNLIPGDDGAELAVRTDRCRLLAAAEMVEPSLAGQVVGIEYQGTRVQVTLDADLGVRLVSHVPDDVFYGRPFQLGERARIGWSPADAHPVIVTNGH